MAGESGEEAFPVQRREGKWRVAVLHLLSARSELLTTGGSIRARLLQLEVGAWLEN